MRARTLVLPLRHGSRTLAARALRSCVVDHVRRLGRPHRRRRFYGPDRDVPADWRGACAPPHLISCRPAAAGRRAPFPSLTANATRIRLPPPPDARARAQGGRKTKLRALLQLRGARARVRRAEECRHPRKDQLRALATEPRGRESAHLQWSVPPLRHHPRRREKYDSRNAVAVARCNARATLRPDHVSVAQTRLSSCGR